ncbi:MAG TPA: hypothetical protein VGO28_09490, partial [Acidimicrobiia bacterium]
MTALRDEFDDSSPGTPGIASAPDPTQSDRFDLGALLAARRHEAFALHERYVNPQMPRVLRTIG